MSPAQARGKTVDKRADIWAFGVVLYKMLTGAQLFEGETVSDTLAHVLTKAPDWDRAPRKTLPGTEGAAFNPFWSPDSRFLGFAVSIFFSIRQRAVHRKHYARFPAPSLAGRGAATG
jgi:serine/threonine protein kinase